MQPIVCAVLLVVLATACRERRPPATEPPPDRAAATRTFRVRGLVLGLDRERGRVVIKHEKIPGYMEAMTMPFEVRDPAELNRLQTNETVDFRLLVTPDKAWIDEIKPSPAAPPRQNLPPREPSLPAEGSFRLVRDVNPLAVGDLMPDYPFTNELGRAVRLSDFNGQALALTFIYTHCPLPNFCPQMGRNFAEACRQLESKRGAPANWHLLSITFDPHRDTQETLREYAARLHYDPARWNFLTGAMIDIDAITEQFGLFFSRQEGTLNWNHNLRTVVIGADGKIKAILIGNQWKPEELVEKLIAAARSMPLELPGQSEH